MMKKYQAIPAAGPALAAVQAALGAAGGASASSAPQSTAFGGSAFGQTAAAPSSAFGASSSAFGASTTKNAFGSSSGGAFGAPAPTTGAPSPFGTPATGASAFGNQQRPRLVPVRLPLDLQPLLLRHLRSAHQQLPLEALLVLSSSKRWFRFINRQIRRRSQQSLIFWQSIEGRKHAWWRT